MPQVPESDVGVTKGGNVELNERMAQSQAKVGDLDQAGEYWSAQRVRGVAQSQHEFCGLTEEQLSARYTVYVPAPVTLEGLAAVISAVNVAVVAMGFGDEKNAAAKDLLALIAKARELACGKPPELARLEDDHAKHVATHIELRQVVEAKRLQDLTQGSTIRVWPNESDRTRVKLVDFRGRKSPWFEKTLNEPVTALIQEAAYAISGGYLDALYDSKAKVAK